VVVMDEYIHIEDIEDTA